MRRGEWGRSTVLIVEESVTIQVNGFLAGWPSLMCDLEGRLAARAPNPVTFTPAAEPASGGTRPCSRASRPSPVLFNGKYLIQ